MIERGDFYTLRWIYQNHQIIIVMDEQTDKVIPSCTTMSDSNPDQEIPVVLNVLTGLDSLLSITCYISTRTACIDVLNLFYVFSKDLWMTKCLLHSFSIDMF